MQESNEFGDCSKKLADFYCHKMEYTLFWGNYYCSSCSKRKFINPARTDRHAVRVQRHFLISEPRPNRRICCTCRHPLMFVCHAEFCSDCHEFHNNNAKDLEYEDGCVDVPIKSSISVSSPIG